MTKAGPKIFRKIIYVAKRILVMWPFQISSQNKVQLCCNLYQLFLQVVAVGRFCTHTDQNSNSGEQLPQHLFRHSLGAGFSPGILSVRRKTSKSREFGILNFLVRRINASHLLVIKSLAKYHATARCDEKTSIAQDEIWTTNLQINRTGIENWELTHYSTVSW